MHIREVSFTESSNFLGLDNFDVAELNWNVRTITFTGNLVGGGTVEQSFTTDGQANGSAETFNFGTSFTNLSSVTWNSPFVYYDNFVVAPIPEPSSLLLFAVGILAIVGMGYRQRMKVE